MFARLCVCAPEHPDPCSRPKVRLVLRSSDGGSRASSRIGFHHLSASDCFYYLLLLRRKEGPCHPVACLVEDRTHKKGRTCKKRTKGQNQQLQRRFHTYRVLFKAGHRNFPNHTGENKP